MEKILTEDDIFRTLTEIKRIEMGFKKLRVLQSEYRQFVADIGAFRFEISAEPCDVQGNLILDTTIFLKNKSMCLDELPHLSKYIINDDKPAYEILQILHKIITDLDKSIDPLNWKEEVRCNNITT